jgi:NADH dehydrogenase FAD-containing subunit
MLPGHVAGLYPRDAMEIDLEPLAAAAGAEFLADEAVGIDVAARSVRLKSGVSVPYDILSIDIGITPDLSEVSGAAEDGIAVKPIGEFLAKWDRLKSDALRPDGPRRIAVVGGGLAGLCLVIAVAAAIRRGAQASGLDPKGFTLSLVSATAPPELNPGMKRRVMRALRRHRIVVYPSKAATSIGADGVSLSGGGFVPADRVLVSTHATAPPALVGTALGKDEGGFLAIRPTLQSVSHEEVFAAGDCATMVDHPRPKAGVFAVRQGPILAKNLRRFARGERLEHRTQKWPSLLGSIRCSFPEAAHRSVRKTGSTSR